MQIIDAGGGRHASESARVAIGSIGESDSEETHVPFEACSEIAATGVDPTGRDGPVDSEESTGSMGSWKSGEWGDRAQAGSGADGAGMATSRRWLYAELEAFDRRDRFGWSDAALQVVASSSAALESVERLWVSAGRGASAGDDRIAMLESPV